MSEQRHDVPQDADAATEVHTKQAGLFADRYGRLAADRFGNAFVYGRWRIGRIIGRLLGPGGGRRALDAGCGQGFWVHWLDERGFLAQGTDASVGMLKAARELVGPEQLVRSDVRALPYRSGTFDVALSIEVVRYLPDPAPALRELHRVLRPDGVAIVTAAPLLALHGYGLLNPIVSRLRFGPFTKLRQYFTTAGTLRAAMREAGFEDVRVFGVFLGPFVLLDRLAPRAGRWLLERWSRIDERLPEDGWHISVTNHLLAIGRKPAGS